MDLNEMIRIAVVIPCRNEARNIAECVKAVYDSDLPQGSALSVYVVDGKSDDGTLDILEGLKAVYPSLNVVCNERQLTPYAFNLGIYAAEDFDYLQIIGARHIVSANYIGACLQTLQEHVDIWCAGGMLINEYENETGKTIACAMGSTFGMGLGNFRTLNKSGYTDTVTSPMYPKFVFERIGYFDEELVRNQDDDFNFRVTREGGRIYFLAEASLRYYVRGTVSGLWRQFFQYGYWKVYVNKKHQAVTTLRQLVPPLFVAYLALWLLSVLFGATVFVIASVPILLYLMLCILFAAKTSAKNAVSFWNVLVIFPVLHISYGLGYMKGIFEFLLLGKKPSEKQKRLSR